MEIVYMNSTWKSIGCNKYCDLTSELTIRATNVGIPCAKQILKAPQNKDTDEYGPLPYRPAPPTVRQNMWNVAHACVANMIHDTVQSHRLGNQP